MKYYIDGYNYLFLLNKEEKSFEDQRESLLNEFATLLMDFKARVIIVFDAYKTHGEKSCINYKNLNVVYTPHNQSADDYLIERVELSKVPKAITVVSNDKRLLKQVSYLSGSISSFETFLAFVKKKTKKAKDFKPSSMSNKEFNRYEEEFKKRMKKI